jgi:hypothetical protein
VRSSETSVDFYRSARGYIPEDGTLHSHRCGNLTSNWNGLIYKRIQQFLCGICPAVKQRYYHSWPRQSVEIGGQLHASTALLPVPTGSILPYLSKLILARVLPLVSVFCQFCHHCDYRIVQQLFCIIVIMVQTSGLRNRNRSGIQILTDVSKAEADMSSSITNWTPSPVSRFIGQTTSFAFYDSVHFVADVCWSINVKLHAGNISLWRKRQDLDGISFTLLFHNSKLQSFAAEMMWKWVEMDSECWSIFSLIFAWYSQL